MSFSNIYGSYYPQCPLVVIPQLGSAYKGFLLDSKAIGSLCRVSSGPGSPGNRPPRVPRASSAWFPAQNPQIQKIALALLVVNKMP